MVITAPQDNAGGVAAGAVYLFNGETGALISTVIGSHPGDQIGDYGVTALTTGNYVVVSPDWSGGRGAATFGNGTTGVSGIVSPQNSLVGDSADDNVGEGNVALGNGQTGVVPLSNGNYVVFETNWNNGTQLAAGAVTLGNGTSGTVGMVSPSNSLVGSTTYDQLGSEGVTVLTNNNYVVDSPLWDNGGAQDVGAVTFGSGTFGATGTVSFGNSLIGSSAFSGVGSDGVTALKNGNYVVSSPGWQNGAVSVGAVTFANGTAGISGFVSSSNSLVGETSEDAVGEGNGPGTGVLALNNGNYVVLSPGWANGTATNAGAVTFGNGTHGTTGQVSSSNSLVGTHTGDQLGSGGVVQLSTSNYVVDSPLWNGTTESSVGAVTFGNGTVGTSGIVGISDSLIGQSGNDKVGSGGVTALSGGNYAIASPLWDISGSPNVANAGAVTFGSGNSPLHAAVSASNSLVGTKVNDEVGSGGVTALDNGNYVVDSPLWDNGLQNDAGAVTFGAVSGNTGIVGSINAVNSLVGTEPFDNVGEYGVTALRGNNNYNYVVASPLQNTRGAVTFGSGLTGLHGTISATNSLEGSHTGDEVGGLGVVPLVNGNYVVVSPDWSNNGEPDAGAVTFGQASGVGVTGTVSAANSLVGDQEDEFLGEIYVGTAIAASGITLLTNGNYVVSSPDWSNGNLGDAGAVTLGSGATGTAGTVTSPNSAVGASRFSGLELAIIDNVNGAVYGSFPTDGGGRVRVGSQTGGFVVSDNPPVIISNGGGTTAAISIPENTTAVTTVAATDPDSGQTLTYSISGGADANLFTIGGANSNALVPFIINSSTGALSFRSAPNFEAPGDANQDNIYDVSVEVSDDDGGVASQTLKVSVTNVNEPPTIGFIADPPPILEDASQQTIALSNITDGPESGQSLTVTATSSNTALIPNPTVDYTSPSTTGSLLYTPVANASGTAVITVTVRDSGGTANGGVDTVVETFTVTVMPIPEVASVFVAGSAWTSPFLNTLATTGLGDAALGYAVPGGPAQLTSLPWSNVNQISIRFTENVNVDQSSLIINGVVSPTYNIKAFSYSAATDVATWTLAGPVIAADRLHLDLQSTGADAVTDAAGHPLDGDWTDGSSAFPSGNGVPGGDFRFGFNVVPGDTNQDGIVNGLDISKIASHWLQSGNATADVNGDGIVNGLDISAIASHWLTILPTDTEGGNNILTAEASGTDIGDRDEMRAEGARISLGIAELQSLRPATASNDIDEQPLVPASLLERSRTSVSLAPVHASQSLDSVATAQESTSVQPSLVPLVFSRQPLAAGSVDVVMSGLSDGTYNLGPRYNLYAD